MEQYNEIFRRAKDASRLLAVTDENSRNAVLLRLADMIEESADIILPANAADLARMDKDNPLYDRLLLTPERLASIASDMRHVAELECPVGEVIEQRTLPNGIELRRVRCPYGVLGVIYEARPNVTFDVFALAFKTGNACVLKGGHDADSSNQAAIALIRSALKSCGMPVDSAILLPSDHEATAAMLAAEGYIDVCIPRGGRRLIDFVRHNAKIPVIETGAGVVNTYFHSKGDLEMGRGIVTNGKTRRVSVCNALDTLLIDSARLADLPALVSELAEKKVLLHADQRALAVLRGHYPDELLAEATPDDWDREWMSLQMGVCTVDGLEQAIAHINTHGSGHSEAIITDDPSAADEFQARIDASCVYVNLPTSFTDGAQFGLGAEIGISTQKLGPRGPMGLREITTYRWLLNGHGQLRP